MGDGDGALDRKTTGGRTHIIHSCVLVYDINSYSDDDGDNDDDAYTNNFDDSDHECLFIVILAVVGPVVTVNYWIVFIIITLSSLYSNSLALVHLDPHDHSHPPP